MKNLKTVLALCAFALVTFVFLDASPGQGTHPDCDCESDGTTCVQPLPASCQNSSECEGCFGPMGFACNSKDSIDICDCVDLADFACAVTLIGTCVDDNCVNPMFLPGAACDGNPTVSNCKN